MGEEFRLRIGDIGVRLRWEDVTIEDLDHAFYRDFVIAGDEPVDVDLRVHGSPLPEYTPDSVLFDAVENHWRLYDYDDKYVIEIFSPTPPHPRDYLILMERDFGRGEVWAESLRFGLLMRPLSEILVVNHLCKNNGVLAHALGVDDQGKGLMFFGRTGTGKTTLANLYKDHCKDTTVLSDERVVIRKRDKRFWIYGTPWPGGAMTASSHRVELKRAFFLEHGHENRTVAEPVGQMIRMMFQHLFLPFWNKKGMDFSLRFCEELIRTIPSRRLSFVNDERIIAFARGIE